MEQAAKLQEYLKKETPEEYKARKEQQAQRKVKKETPEEAKARIEYMRKKEQLEIQAETQRLFEKAEKQRQDHLNYLYRQEKKAEREAERYEREEIRVANEEYKRSPEGRAEQAERDKEKAYKAEKARIWNTPEAREKRERNRIDYEKRLEKQRRENNNGGSRSSSGFCGVYEPRVGSGPWNVEGN
jgi:hypothetical protein